MSSTNKTEKLRLNQWISSDKPRREDFNYDNQVIENNFNNHTGDKFIHITQGERENWNMFSYSGMYYGNGNIERTIDTGCDFEVSFAVVFANNRPLAITRFSESKNHNYMAFAGKLANSTGLKLKDGGKQLVVSQSASAVITNEYVNLNEAGVAYCYVLFR